MARVSSKRRTQKRRSGLRKRRGGGSTVTLSWDEPSDSSANVEDGATGVFQGVDNVDFLNDSNDGLYKAKGTDLAAEPDDTYDVSIPDDDDEFNSTNVTLRLLASEFDKLPIKNGDKLTFEYDEPVEAADDEDEEDEDEGSPFPDWMGGPGPGDGADSLPPSGGGRRRRRRSSKRGAGKRRSTRRRRSSKRRGGKAPVSKGGKRKSRRTRTRRTSRR